MERYGKHQLVICKYRHLATDDCRGHERSVGCLPEECPGSLSSLPRQQLKSRKVAGPTGHDEVVRLPETGVVVGLEGDRQVEGDLGGLEDEAEAVLRRRPSGVRATAQHCRPERRAARVVLELVLNARAVAAEDARQGQ